jgi:hypothetical protein
LAISATKSAESFRIGLYSLPAKGLGQEHEGLFGLLERLKAPGTFWTKKMGECFLFLRSQLLSGRWEAMLDNLTQQTAKQLHSLASEVSANDDQWLKAV